MSSKKKKLNDHVQFNTQEEVEEATLRFAVSILKQKFNFTKVVICFITFVWNGALFSQIDFLVFIKSSIYSHEIFRISINYSILGTCITLYMTQLLWIFLELMINASDLYEIVIIDKINSLEFNFKAIIDFFPVITEHYSQMPSVIASIF